MKLKTDGAAAVSPRDKRLSYASDIAAAVVFVLFSVLFVSGARYGLQNADESAYYTFCHRLLFGDAPIVNEWSMTQLSFVFQYLPFRLYYAVAGGTEGCILFLRYVCIAGKMLLFAFLYLRLRRYRVWAVAAAAVFTGFLPSGMLTLSYYNIAPAAALLAGLLLFAEGTPKPAACVVSGFCFACAVICAPAAAALYLLFSVLAAVGALGKKRGRPVFSALPRLTDGRIWLFVTAGIALCAAVYLGVLFAKGGVTGVLGSIPELLRDKTFSTEGMTVLEKLKWEKFLRFFRLFGVPALVLNAAYLIGAPVVRRFLRKYRVWYFAAGCALFLCTVVCFHLHSAKMNCLGEIIYLPLLPCAFGPACYLLTDRKEPRRLAFFVFGALFSVCMDLPSNISFGGACVVADVPAILMTGALVRELVGERGDGNAQEERKKSKKKTAAEKTAGTIAGICAGAVLLTLAASQAYNAFLTRTRPTLESFNFNQTSEAMTATVTRGPLKGLRTLPELRTMCENAMDDLDTIRESTGKPIYCADFCPWFYLYAELPYGTFSTSYVEDDSRDRLLRYWERFPDAVPEYVYIPSFNCDNYKSADGAAMKNKLEWFQSLFACETLRGKTGFVLKLGKMK